MWSAGRPQTAGCSCSWAGKYLEMLRLDIQVSYYLFFPVLIMCIMCIVCLGYLSFLPTSALASVLCTCIFHVHIHVYTSIVDMCIIIYT